MFVLFTNYHIHNALLNATRRTYSDVLQTAVSNRFYLVTVGDGFHNVLKQQFRTQEEALTAALDLVNANPLWNYDLEINRMSKHDDALRFEFETEAAMVDFALQYGEYIIEGNSCAIRDMLMALEAS